jgi:protein-arginine kinase activator protein McsA
MASNLICPNCGDEGSIAWKFDAWARFEITGVDADGMLLKSSDFHTEIFDHNEIECSTCGRLFDEQEIVGRLQRE